MTTTKSVLRRLCLDMSIRSSTSRNDCLVTKLSLILTLLDMTNRLLYNFNINLAKSISLKILIKDLLSQ